MLGLVALAAGGLGLLLGVYVVAERALTNRGGCLACGRSWHRAEDVEFPISPNVRVIARSDLEVPSEKESTNE